MRRNASIRTLFAATLAVLLSPFVSAFTVISYTSNWAYLLFAALGSWIGGFLSITILNRFAPRQH